ncbi:MAG: NDP-sugar synthase [Prevotella sp.]|jgi:NDP-sugar pyrophosphorylase family protein|nr:NDP-sugar synthase [Prevotella sp.]
MKYAIIAAGEGSRLQQEGVSSPKPLVKIGGEMLIDRLFRVFQQQDATEIVVICNEQMTEVRHHLQQIQQAGSLPLKFIVKSTPSSMHSLWELSPWLADEPFVLTTVDTIFREREFTDYVQTFQTLVGQQQADGLMGVTDYIDDEKPLYVATDDDLRITGFLDACETPRYISGGIYGLTPRSLTTLQRCIERGESRMRNFQRALVHDGLLLKAFPFSKVLDIDHASDIQKAEEFIVHS